MSNMKKENYQNIDITIKFTIYKNDKNIIFIEEPDCTAIVILKCFFSLFYNMEATSWKRSFRATDSAGATLNKIIKT